MGWGQRRRNSGKLTTVHQAQEELIAQSDTLQKRLKCISEELERKPLLHATRVRLTNAMKAVASG